MTGASGGLGTAVVDAYLEAGATVVGVSRSKPERPGVARYHALAADLTSAEAAAEAVQQAAELAGKVDILAHVMGGFAMGSTAESDAGVWRRMMAMNLDAAFYVLRAVLPRMRKNGWGRVVAVGSRAGVERPAGVAAYAVSKAALHALIEIAANESKDSNVTVNAVLPSVIDTAANRAAMPDADFSAWVKPEAIARQMVWLSSEDAADVSGALLPIYGRA